MYTEDNIIEFIEVVRSCFPNSIEICTQGNCGTFARILNTTFSGGEIINLSIGHRVFLYAGNIYDITGKVTDKYRGQKSLPILEDGLEEAISYLKPRYKN